MALNNVIDKIQSAAESMLGKGCVRRIQKDQSNEGFPCLDVGVDDALVAGFIEKNGEGTLYSGSDSAFAKEIDGKLMDKGTIVEGRMTIDSVYLMTVYPAGKTRKNKYLG